MGNETLGRRIGKLRGEVRLREIEGVVARWREWEGTQSSFCASLGISTQSLVRWRRAAGGKSMARSPFIELGRSAAPRSFCYEVVLPSGASVRAPAGFNEGEVARLLALAVAAC